MTRHMDATDPSERLEAGDGKDDDHRPVRPLSSDRPPRDRIRGHGRVGSNVAWTDPAAELAVAYVTNGIRDEVERAMRTNAIGDAVRTALT